MHTIYEKLWLISSELNHLTKVNKKSLYMAISVMFWILVATIFCVVLGCLLFMPVPTHCIAKGAGRSIFSKRAFPAENRAFWAEGEPCRPAP